MFTIETILKDLTLGNIEQVINIHNFESPSKSDGDGDGGDPDDDNQA